MKITDAILGEHTAMRPLLRQVREQTAPNRKADPAIVRANAAALKVIIKAHASVEEPCLLIPIRSHPAAKHALAEHCEIDDLLDTAIKDGDQKVLHKAVRLTLGHFAEEERDVFPVAEKLLSPAKLSQLGAKWAEMRGVRL